MVSPPVGGTPVALRPQGEEATAAGRVVVLEKATGRLGVRVAAAPVDGLGRVGQGLGTDAVPLRLPFRHSLAFRRRVPVLAAVVPARLTLADPGGLGVDTQVRDVVPVPSGVVDALAVTATALPTTRPAEVETNGVPAVGAP